MDDVHALDQLAAAPRRPRALNRRTACDPPKTSSTRSPAGMPSARRGPPRDRPCRRADRRPGHVARPSGRPGRRSSQVASNETATRRREPRRRAHARPGITLPSHSTTGCAAAAAASSTGIGDVAAGREDRGGPPAGEDGGRLRDGRAQAERVEDDVGVPLDRAQRSQREPAGAGCRRPGRASPRARDARRASAAQRRPAARAATGRRPAPGRCARPCPRPRSAVASFPGPLLDRLAGHRQQHPDRGEADDERRPTGAR